MAKRVLVVEDNELNLKLFCDLLRAHGFETEGVRDGRDAVARARAFQPDLLITDIQLPHMSGYDLIAQVRGDLTLRSIPILAVTAYASRADEERIRAAGANAYVSKPIALAAFVAQVNALLPVPAPPEDLPEAPTSEEPLTPGPAALLTGRSRTECGRKTVT